MKGSPGIRSHTGAILLILLVLAGVSGCTQSERPSGMPQSDQYAFLDHQISYYGTLESGRCPSATINVSTYRFDTGTGSLEGMMPFEINDSLLLISGESVLLSGDYGTGGFGMLAGGYSLPYTSGNLTVNGFTTDGTMYLTYRNQTIALEPGTQWTGITTGVDVTRACTINRTVTDVITYYGTFQKSAISKTTVYT